MKKVYFLSAVILLLISGCQFVTILLPTPSVSTPEFSDTPVGEDPTSPTISVTLDASPNPVQTFTASPTTLPTATPTRLPLILQSGSPAYIQNFAHIDAGCSWLGIAGQVFDANGKTINNLVVNVTGKLGQTEIDMIALTGIPEANIYGPGGYEIVLADKAIKSENTLRIQVFNINGSSMSNPVPFATYLDCEKNLIIINFIIK